jgi:hypothetical protein
MEGDVHRVVGLAEAVRLLGSLPKGTDISREAVECLGEALLAAAESVREQWRAAFELTRTKPDTSAP